MCKYSIDARVCGIVGSVSTNKTTYVTSGSEDARHRTGQVTTRSPVPSVLPYGNTTSYGFLKKTDNIDEHFKTITDRLEFTKLKVMNNERRVVKIQF